jgi:hypothetical protein
MARSPDAVEAAADGAAPRRAREADKEAKDTKDEAVSVYLVSDRGRRGSWMLGGGVIGGLMVWKFGTVAAAMGGVLLLVGLYHAWFFVKSLRNDPGTVAVDAQQLSLPTGLCEVAPPPLATSELTAAYFLRHSVPWTHTGPVLVIEAGGRAYLYPRDWFASEADQRRIMHAVLPHLARRAGAASAGAAR